MTPQAAYTPPSQPPQPRRVSTLQTPPPQDEPEQSNPKDRQRRARAIRRTLASLPPSSCHPQPQSPLFPALPSELRIIIYTHTLRQTRNYSQPIGIHSLSPRHGHGHTHHTRTCTTLLQTCRRIYSEAWRIPMRSATHHFRYQDRWSPIYLHHLPAPLGAHLYHLHDTLTTLESAEFTKFLSPHC
ncbi:hypothetical protein CC86DRAFT_375069 [Ophiobolus disseminans]|uniref:2EXR domain-containing protein n=1 Tax=Ophiobolus disseminans TaxID=1469910 RepID=A0A6A6ZEM6_9PLEO|nr:hypothetical protein CC86DRAFT_375069 [Ophiobolus disseminans]